MDNITELSITLDKAFGLLLMAQTVIDVIIPESDDEKAKLLATRFVIDLISNTIDELSIKNLPSFK